MNMISVLMSFIFAVSCAAAQTQSDSAFSHYPSSGSIMGHFLTDGPKNYKDGVWAIRFRYLWELQGDTAFGVYEVITSHGQYSYRYKMSASFGSKYSVSIRRWNNDPLFKVGERVKVNPKWGDCPRNEVARVVIGTESCETCASDWLVITKPAMTYGKDGSPVGYDSEWFMSLEPKRSGGTVMWEGNPIR